VDGEHRGDDRAGRCAIAIMAKAPDAGRVKTRLLPVLRAKEAQALSACFLRDMTRMLAAAGREAAVDGYIAFAPAGSEASFAPIVPPGTGYVLADGRIDAPAGVEGFGCCLLQAARTLFALGYGAVGLLNSDSPTLPPSLIVEAARLLAAPGDSAVLGPSTDGGYYLLGMKAPHPELFTAIDWSTERVAAQTRVRAHERGLAIAEIAAWYDVDDPDSLAHLLRDLGGSAQGEPRAPYVAPFTAEWLNRHGIAQRLSRAEEARVS
jgi:rSAM/selenodomain-associated transferase 1